MLEKGEKETFLTANLVCMILQGQISQILLRATKRNVSTNLSSKDWIKKKKTKRNLRQVHKR